MHAPLEVFVVVRPRIGTGKRAHKPNSLSGNTEIELTANENLEASLHLVHHSVLDVCKIRSGDPGPGKADRGIGRAIGYANEAWLADRAPGLLTEALLCDSEEVSDELAVRVPVWARGSDDREKWRSGISDRDARVESTAVSIMGEREVVVAEFPPIVRAHMYEPMISKFFRPSTCRIESQIVDFCFSLTQDNSKWKSCWCGVGRIWSGSG